MVEPTVENIQIDSETAVQRQEPLPRPEGAYSLGKVYRPIVGDNSGIDNSAVFLTLEAAQQYVIDNYPEALPFLGDVTYASLNSLEPGINPGRFVIQADDVWTTAQPQAGDSLMTRLRDGEGIVAFAYEDRNHPASQEHQRSNIFTRKIGTWINEEEAAAFYKEKMPDKKVRSGSIPQQIVTSTNKIGPNEIYLQPRTVQLNPAQ